MWHCWTYIPFIACISRRTVYSKFAISGGANTGKAGGLGKTEDGAERAEVLHGLADRGAQ